MIYKMKKGFRSFSVIIEKDEDGYYVGSVACLKGCHTQGETMAELLKNIKEAIELCLEVEAEVPRERFVGVKQVQVKV